MKDGCCWTVVNGSKINIWEDPWIPNMLNKAPQRLVEVHGDIKNVQDLMLPDENKWDEVKLQQLFNHSEVQKILEIYLPEDMETGITDKILWIHHPN